MANVQHLGFLSMLAAYGFVLLAMVLVRWRRIGREGEIAYAALRMSLQLGITGYVLVWVFENPGFWLTMGLFAVMLSFAVDNTFSRVKVPLNRRLAFAVGFALVVGGVLSVFYFLAAVVQVKPFYDPRYFIPLAGMLTGNSMTGVGLGVKTLVTSVQDNREEIEGSLMLGASAKQATNKHLNKAFDAAILPTINSMVGIGIVSLPGMMTGQILAGSSPLVAIAYQIAIMLAILGATALVLIIFVNLAYKAFFTPDLQLDIPK